MVKKKDPSNMQQYVAAITNDLLQGKKHNKPAVEKIAASFGITNKNHVKELTELAIVNIARNIAHQPITVHERYNQIVNLYNTQVNLSHRTSESMRLQQYSTPAPIAFVAGIFCGFDKPGEYFEPSAGNGLLTIVGKPGYFIVNEIDDIRNENLKTQRYKEVLSQDGSKPFARFANRFDAIITNPPFGSLMQKELVGNFWTKVMDHQMAAIALHTMKNKGKAAIIIGGHTTWDQKGRIQAGKNREFFVYLYKHYNVLDVINIDGHKLYSRQGTAFNTRLILIDGRKTKPEGFPPLQKTLELGVDTFEDLYKRVMRFVDLKESPEAPTSKLSIDNRNQRNTMKKTISGKTYTLQEVQPFLDKKDFTYLTFYLNSKKIPFNDRHIKCIVLRPYINDASGWATKYSRYLQNVIHKDKPDLKIDIHYYPRNYITEVKKWITQSTLLSAHLLENFEYEDSPAFSLLPTIPQTTTSMGTMEISRNTDKQGIEAKFSEKPSADLISRLKQIRFRYSRRQQLWYAKYDTHRWSQISALQAEYFGEKKKAEIVMVQDAKSMTKYLSENSFSVLLDDEDDIVEFLNHKLVKKSISPAVLDLVGGKLTDAIDWAIQYMIYDLAGKTPPHEMNLHAFSTGKFIHSAKTEFSILGKALAVFDDSYKAEHKKHIQKAMDDGIVVDHRVLADYPEISKTNVDADAKTRRREKEKAKARARARLRLLKISKH